MLDERIRKCTKDKIMKLAALPQAMTTAPEIITDPSYGLGNAEPFSQTRQERPVLPASTKLNSSKQVHLC